jgi:hypothetical protein
MNLDMIGQGIVHKNKGSSIGKESIHHGNTIGTKSMVLKHLCNKGPINPIISLT